MPLDKLQKKYSIQSGQHKTSLNAQLYTVSEDAEPTQNRSIATSESISSRDLSQEEKERQGPKKVQSFVESKSMTQRATESPLSSRKNALKLNKHLTIESIQINDADSDDNNDYDRPVRHRRNVSNLSHRTKQDVTDQERKDSIKNPEFLKKARRRRSTEINAILEAN